MLTRSGALAILTFIRSVSLPVARGGIFIPPLVSGDETIVVTSHQIKAASGVLKYEARAGRLPIRNDESGEVRGYIFFVAYGETTGAPRPLAYLERRPRFANPAAGSYRDVWTAASGANGSWTTPRRWRPVTSFSWTLSARASAVRRSRSSIGNSSRHWVTSRQPLNSFAPTARNSTLLISRCISPVKATGPGESTALPRFWSREARKSPGRF